LPEEYEYVIQRYIKDVLLLLERKSEIRIYWIIASFDPLKVLVFPQGTVRLTTEKFKLGDYDNPLIHITNTHQQKKSSKSDEEWIENSLYPKIKEYLAYVAKAVQEPMMMRKPEQGMFFGLFGAYFLIMKRESRN
jgi:hypothetical protein